MEMKNVVIPTPTTQAEGYEIRKRQYPDVSVQSTERIRPYFSVLQLYFSVSYRTVNDVRMQKRTPNIYEDDKQPFPCARR